MMDMRKNKTKRIVAGVIAIVLAVAMIATVIIGAFL